MRYAVGALGILALGVAGVAGAETLREQSRRTVELPNVSTVSIQNARGGIELRPSRDGALHLTALKTIRASSSALARRMASETMVELSRQGSRYRIQVKYPKNLSVRVKLWDFDENTVPRSNLHLVVEVPRSVAVELDAASGDLSSEDLPNAQRLETASGDIIVEAATGPVTIETASGDVRVVRGRWLDVNSVSGDVRVEEIRGSVTVGTASGDVRVTGAADSIRIETVSGDVAVERAPTGAWVKTASGEIVLRSVKGRLTASTVSADIRASLEGPVRESRIESASGDVSLGLGSDAACTIEMRTSSGDLQVDVPARTREVSRKRLTAVVRDGTVPVWLETVSGSISVTRGEP